MNPRMFSYPIDRVSIKASAIQNFFTKLAAAFRGTSNRNRMLVKAMTTMFATVLDIPLKMNTAVNLITGLLCVESSQPLKPQRRGPSSVVRGPPPVMMLDEATLLKIFSFLSLKDLLRVSLVCQWWYRLSFDRALWKCSDLRRFSRSLSKGANLPAFCTNRLAGKIQCLDLSGFTITRESLRILACQCSKLRVLKLKSVTFTADFKANNQGVCSFRDDLRLFPSKLECLDLRFSRGDFRVYRAIAKSLSNVKWLGICDALLQTLLTHGTLETTVASLKHLRKLDASHCLLLKDNTLALFKRCRELEVMSLRKCCCLTGSSIQGFLGSCASLKTLILDGISMDDETLQNIDWATSTLKHLELGWCPLITSVGLTASLPSITKVSTLEYLGLCAIGDGKAMNDDILRTLASSLSRWRCTNLRALNLSSSQCITYHGFEAFHHMVSSVETLDTTNCPRIEKYLAHNVKNVEAIASECNLNATYNEDISGFAVQRTRRGSSSATQFARSKYTLETSL